jgi:ubiquitin carboxyl-terminal hydrolase 1
MGGQGETTLASCIAEYLAPELLSGVTCEMCSLRLTIEHYQSESTRLSHAPNHPAGIPTQSSNTPSGAYAALENLPSEDASSTISDKRKKKARDARKVEARLRVMLESGTISHFGESAIPPLPSEDGGGATLPVKWQKVNSDSVREGAITRPPQSLRLHCIRSGYTNYGQLVKKSARIVFPTILDLTPFVANGVWEEKSSIQELLSGTAKVSTGPRVLYRLESVILHYGLNHSSGHYICIRRKPKPRLGGGATYHPSYGKKSCPDGCRCENCAYFGQVRGEEESIPGRGWLRVSDDDVEEVGEEALVGASAAVFMLFYEKIGEYAGKKDNDIEQIREGAKL